MRSRRSSRAVGRSGIFERGAGHGFALWAAAFHLFRTIERDCEPGAEASGQLAPCWGHMMAFGPDLNEVVNLPCPSGGDGTVRHAGDMAEVELPDDVRFSVTAGERARSVREFSQEVRAFSFAMARAGDFEADLKRRPRFTDEWKRRHEAGA